MAAHPADVEALALGLGQVDAGGHRGARREALQPVGAAVAEHRKAGARFAQGPFEQGVVAAGDHRVMGLEGFLTGAELGVAAEPGGDDVAREQELAGDPADRDDVVADQLIDLALLDAEQLGQFPGGQVVGHGAGGPPTARTLTCSGLTRASTGHAHDGWLVAMGPRVKREDVS
jgi:hypothetical protein